MKGVVFSMSIKVELNDTVNTFESNQNKTNVNKDFVSVKGTTFNVMQSSEISKVLRELTQCVASEHDLLVPNSQDSVWDVNCTISNSTEPVSRNDISCSEVSGSTTTNCSMDIVPDRRECQTFICDDCGKHFSKKDFLQKHRIVHEEPRHRCNVCEKSFVREDKLKRHFVSIHSKQRPHICAICAKAFARKDKLKDHQKHHLTVSNNFLCVDCHIPFVQKSDLNRHIRTVHKADDNVPNGSLVTSHSTEARSSLALSMSATLLPLLSAPSQSVISVGIASTKARKTRPRRSTRPQRRTEAPLTTGPTLTSNGVTTITSMAVRTISNEMLCPPKLPLLGHLQCAQTSYLPHVYHQPHPYAATSSSPPPTIPHDSSLLPYPPSSSSSSTAIVQAPSPQHVYHQHRHHPMISSVLSLSSSTTIATTSTSDNLIQHLRPLATGGMLLTHHHNHQSLCHLPQQPQQPPPPQTALTYYPYLQQQRPTILGNYSSTFMATSPVSIPPRTLTTNIYPYLPF